MKKEHFKQAIKEGKVVLGTWAQMNSPECVEIIGKAGFDFVIIDTEHGYFGLETAENMVRAADAFSVVPIIRVSEKNPTLIMKSLDMGAQGVIVPGISSKEDAILSIRASKYGPFGNRGACPCIRAAGHMAWDWTTYAKCADENTVIFLLIEGPEGVKNFEDIITVEGVDVILMGPFDLSVALGVGGQVDHPIVIEKFKKMIKLAASKNIALAALVFDMEEDKMHSTAEYWFNLGVKIMTVGTDKMLLSHKYSSALKAITPKK
jgi:4-hydroxy-2-oxoheptanedioate aldolase